MGAWPLFHFLNPILHSFSSLYLSPLCDHVAGSVRFHQGGRGPPCSWARVVLCKVRLCVQKTWADCTGGGWPRARQTVRENMKSHSSHMALTRYLHGLVRSAGRHIQPPQQSLAVSHLPFSLRAFLIHSKIRKTTAFPCRILMLFSHGSQNKLTSPALSIASLWVCRTVCKTVELSMKPRRLQWGTSNIEIQSVSVNSERWRCGCPG